MLVLFGFIFIILGLYKFCVNIQYNPGPALGWAFLAMFGAGLLQAV